jgi:hypothetical protein
MQMKATDSRSFGLYFFGFGLCVFCRRDVPTQRAHNKSHKPRDLNVH